MRRYLTGWIDAGRAIWRIVCTFVRQLRCQHPWDQWRTEMDDGGGVIQCRRCGKTVDSYLLDKPR